MDYNKLIFIEKHFRSNFQNFNIDAMFNIIERTAKILDDMKTIKAHKDK